MRKELSRGGWLQRYSMDDGFGQPTVAFVICTFWLIEAWQRPDAVPRPVKSWMPCTRRCPLWVFFPRITILQIFECGVIFRRTFIRMLV